ncbi:hypothetical protein N2152v2_006425 [Parachlorella kessleri]
MEAMQEALKNPEVAARMKAMEESMKNPAMQDQMSQMMSVMQNPSFVARMQELREDPELKPVFEEMRAGGMGAMMKYMNDPAFLAKIGEKMGDVDALTGSGAAAAAPSPPQDVEIKSILDAVKYDDMEAVEDYVAIGKGGITDEEGRTALHYAAAYNRAKAVEVLLEHKAQLEACDRNAMTPLHYAAGYGRGDIVKLLVEAGANVKAQNASGQTPAAIVRGEPRNPLNEDADLLARLEA